MAGAVIFGRPSLNDNLAITAIFKCNRLIKVLVINPSPGTVATTSSKVSFLGAIEWY